MEVSAFDDLWRPDDEASGGFDADDLFSGLSEGEVPELDFDDDVLADLMEMPTASRS